MEIDKSTKITSSSLNRPALQIRSKSSPPEAYSITIARCVGVSITCNEIKMKGNIINNNKKRHALLPNQPYNVEIKRLKIDTSLNRIIFGCLSDLWLMISLATFSSICMKTIAEMR
jgi:hypothetical protein